MKDKSLSTKQMMAELKRLVDAEGGQMALADNQAKRETQELAKSSKRFHCGTFLVNFGATSICCLLI